MNARLKYYKWCLHFTITDKLSGTLIDRLIWAFTGKWLSYPKYHCPMKYNPKTEEFDFFYSWGEYKLVCAAMARTRLQQENNIGLRH